MDICLYTVNTGGYESSIHCRGDVLDCDMLYVSDNRAQLAKAESMAWIPLYVHPPSGMDPVRLQRCIKARPHAYLPKKYNYSIYIDGNASRKIWWQE